MFQKVQFGSDPGPAVCTCACKGLHGAQSLLNGIDGALFVFFHVLPEIALYLNW